jgi:DNA-binding cell septation regulator SpoVG
MINGIEITGIDIYPVSSKDGKRLVGLARVVINDCFQLTNMRIYEGSGGLFVSYPIEFTQKGEEFRQIFYPTRKEIREYFEEEILAEYVKVTGEGA